MIFKNIPENETDRFLKEAKYDLLGEYRKAVSYADFAHNATVLDIGTGSGRMAAVLTLSGFTVLSGDIDPEALKRAHAKLLESGAKGTILFTLDAGSMPFNDESFGTIVCANAIHEMSNPNKVLAEMSRICSQQGTLLVMEFTRLGFDMIASAHKNQHRGIHSEGLLDEVGIDKFLNSNFEHVNKYPLELNNVWVARKNVKKRPEELTGVNVGRERKIAEEKVPILLEGMVNPSK